MMKSTNIQLSLIVIKNRDAHLTLKGSFTNLSNIRIYPIPKDVLTQSF